MTFSAERLAEHVRIISTQIAPRMPTTFVEQSLAYYIEHYLGQHPPQRQRFRAIERHSKRLMPQYVLSAATIGASGNAKGWLRWVAAGIHLGLLWHHRRITTGHPPLWEPALSDAESLNTLVKVPAQQEQATQKIVIVAHLDTNFTRQSQSALLRDTIPLFFGSLGAATLGGLLLTVFAGDREWSGRARTLLASYMMTSSLLIALDEFGQVSYGANDNASGVAVALEVATRLQQSPLPDTDVWFLFTGAEEVGGAGLEAFLKHHQDEVNDARFIVVNSVGAGDVCWGAEHVISTALSYYPAPSAHQWATRTAQQHPHMGIMGRRLTGLDEVAILNRYGLRGVRIAAVDRYSGAIPYRHTTQDIPANIDPQTLQQAADFVWALLTN